MKLNKIFFYSIILIFGCCFNIDTCQANSDIDTNNNPSQEEGLSANPWKKRNKIVKRKKLLYNEHVQQYDTRKQDYQIKQMQEQTQAILQRNAEAREEEIRKQKELEKQNKQQDSNASSEGFGVLDLIMPETNTIENKQSKSETQKQKEEKTEQQPSMLDGFMDGYNKTAKKISKIKRKATNYYNKAKNYTRKSIRNLNNILK